MKRCRQCNALFAPRNTLQSVCSAGCAVVYAATEEAKELRARAIRSEVRRLRKAEETVRTATKKAQAAFNRYIRHRDAGHPCISCGATPDMVYGGAMDAGHYRTTGACPQLRFEPDNCHAQCSRCNRFASGNVHAYRKALVEKLGLERVEWIEGPHPERKWTVDELREIARRFSALTMIIK